MALVTRSLRIRARLEPRPEPPFDRLYDPLVHDLVHEGELARERFASRWPDTAALRRLAETKRAPLGKELARSLAEYHRRLGATEASLAALEQVARGEAVCTVAGQQPAPLGGPLYSLHKTASAAGMCGVVTQRTGVPCVPLFWMHGEDSDFAEIRSATLGGPGLELRDLTLPAAAHPEGGLVGSLPTGPLARLVEQALAVWSGLGGAGEARTLLETPLSRARDLGEAYSALMLALFGGCGLVVVDPRLPEFRAAARDLIDRYLERAESLSAAARAAGDLLERRIGRRPLADPALESFVFAVEDGVRRKVTVAEARSLGRQKPLSPSVALRPVIQDGVFPTVAMACGASEIAYLAQLREVFEGVGVAAACPVPRLSATWMPPAAVELLQASGAQAWDLVAGADQALKSLAEREVPAEVRAELERARLSTLQALERFAGTSARVDPSLPQMVESARGKVDYQFARLLEGLTSKSRHRLERLHPEWPRVRYYLLPGDRLQERRLASLEVIAYRGAAAGSELCELAEEQAERLQRGAHEHLVLDL